MSSRPIVELLDDNKLIVWSIEDARELFNEGFYGKPLGIPRPEKDFDAPLLLDPVEALYLMENNKITIHRNQSNLSKKELKELQLETFDGFKDKYRVYKKLRDMGYVVTPGIKYGSDFAVYEEGPGIDHSPYVVQIMRDSDNLSALEIVKAGRLASTVRKAFIIATVSHDEINFIEFNWWKA